MTDSLNAVMTEKFGHLLYFRTALNNNPSCNIQEIVIQGITFSIYQSEKSGPLTSLYSAYGGVEGIFNTDAKTFAHGFNGRGECADHARRITFDLSRPIPEVVIQIVW